MIFLSGSLSSGVETVGGGREKEREIFPFMFIAFLPLPSTSLFAPARQAIQVAVMKNGPRTAFPITLDQKCRDTSFRTGDGITLPFPLPPILRCLGPAIGLVSVEIHNPNHFLHDLRGGCKKGRGGEKKTGRGGSPLFPIPLPFPFLDYSF